MGVVVIFIGKSFAKINLFLYNLGLRKDNYHEIYTLFLKINLYDTLSIEKSNTTSIRCNVPSIPVDKNNIIMSVDNILRSDYGLKDNYEINLFKRIPSGAGLGGGSSNAATYLKLINDHSNLNLTMEDKIAILSAVGSDTVFFLYDHAALGIGRGEIVRPVSIDGSFHIILVNPQINIPTSKIFSSNKLGLTTLNNVNTIGDIITIDDLLPIMKNDLEPPVFEMYPEVLDLKIYIETLGASKVLMSGAGSSVFGLFKSKKCFDNAYLNIKQRFDSYLVLKV